MANGKGNTLGAGRPKGVLNKSTTEVREAIAAFASANVEKMGERLNAIDNPEKKLDLYLKAIEYHIPKLQRVDTNHSGSVGVTSIPPLTRAKESQLDESLESEY